MLKQAGLLAVALATLLMTQPARARSPFDNGAYSLLVQAYDVAFARYQTGSAGGGGFGLSGGGGLSGFGGGLSGGIGGGFTGGVGGDGYPMSPNAYWAMLYSYYAQNYAALALTDNNRLAWNYAYVYGFYASYFAQADYQTTGDPSSYDAYVYAYYGYLYAYYAFLYFS